jgi:biotin carboxyl carrier protein
MKLQAEIEDQKHEVEIRRDGDIVYADVDGRSYELEASQPEPNIYLLKIGGEIYDVFVSPSKTMNQPLQVRVKGHELEIKLIDPKRLRGAGLGHDHGDGLAEIKTAMPGKVVRVLVESGAEVKKGDGVIIVEAMKMQNEMKSPKDGIVKEIRASEGATVNAGDILAIVD